MNKKVALSLLSATVISSMAASAFAAPNSGIYMGGDVDRYYSLTDLMNLNAQGLAKFNTDLGKAGSKNIVFVDYDKKGAFLEEIFNSTDGLEKVKRDLKQSDFEGVYTQVKPDGTDGATYDPRKDIDPEPAGELKVESVSAINAKQLVVKFGTAVDKDTVISSGNLVNTAFQKNGADLTGTNPAVLSEDGKTLTITLDSGTWEGTYLFSVKKDSVKSTAGEFIAAYDEKVTYEDTVAPTLVGTETVNASKVKVNFSEPIDDYGTLTAKLADGTDLSGVVSPTIDGNSVVLDLSDAGIPSGKEITVSFVGVVDFSGNLVDPNPVTVKVQKGALDGVAPTVSSVTVINAKKFELKFSEEIEGLLVTEISLDGVPLTSADTLTQDKTDKTKYVVTLDSAKQGLVTVSIAGGAFTDLSGESNAAFSKIVNFPTDSVAPTLSTATVSKNKDGKEVLTLTFSEDVTVKATTTVTATAKKVSNYVTSTVNVTFDPSDLTPVTGKANQFTIELNQLSDSVTTTLTEGATYTVDLPAALVTDTAGNDNVAAAKAFTFTRGTDADTAKPGIDTTYDSGESTPQVVGNGIKVTGNNTIELRFDRAVDGASATNKANYVVTGATVEDVALLAGNVVELTLAADSNTYTGLRTIKVSGVKSADGVVMDEYTTKEYLVENVRPTVTGVAVTSIDALTSETIITLTFSEAVTAGSSNTEDFDLYIKGSKVTGVTIATSTGADNEILVSIDQALTEQDFINGVTLKAQADADIADTKGNVANITGDIQVSL
ncbi:hypothetical protein [Brevibacillus gelatini]